MPGSGLGLRMPGIGLRPGLRVPGAGLRIRLGMPGSGLRSGLRMPWTRLGPGLRVPGSGLRSWLRMGPGLRIDGLGRIRHRRVRMVVSRSLSGVIARIILNGSVMVLRSARALRSAAGHARGLNIVKKGLDFQDLVVERNRRRGESRARVTSEGQNRYERRKVSFFHSIFPPRELLLCK